MKNRILIRILFLSIQVFIINAAHAQNYVWAKNMGSTGNDWGQDIKVDGSGNSYVIGYFSGTADFDPGAGIAILTSTGDDDIFIAKYDTSGNFLWAKRIGSTDTDRGLGLAVDVNGNAYVTGEYYGTVDFDPGAATANLTSIGLGDIFLAQFNSSGNYQWAKSIGGVDYDTGNEITLDASGNLYLTGYFRETTDFDPGAGTANLTALGTHDIFLAKYNSTGNYLWAKAMGSTNNDEAYSVTLDGSGNSYITGYFQGAADFDPGAGMAILTPVGVSDIFIAKYDASGNFLWAHNIGGTWVDVGSAIAVDGNGNTYLTGIFWQTADFDPGAGTANLTSAGAFDIFIAKYDASGNYLWAKNIGSTGSDVGDDIALDDGGNFWITGGFTGSVDFDSGAGTANLTSSGSEDIFFAKYSSTGDYLWAKAVGGTGQDEGTSIAVDGGGNTYLTGFFGGTADFDPGTNTANLSPAGAYDIFIARYDAVPTSVSGLEAGDIGFSIQPNPVRNSTTVTISLVHPQTGSLKVFDVNGRLITTLADKMYISGENKMVWDASGVNAGVYFLQFQTKEKLYVEKIIVTK